MEGMAEENEDKSLEFKWLKKRGVGGKDKKIQFYESFIYDGVEYNLYDCVYMYKEGYPEPYIGKVIKIWEFAGKTKKVKVQWFFYVWEILNFIGDKKALDKEIFLASGEGSGLANVNPLEAIAGKCNVVCISKDSRNSQPSDEELEAADFIFYRTFDVQSCTILDNMDEKVGGLEIKYVFNRNKHDNASSIPKLTSERKEDMENAARCDETLQRSSQNPLDISNTIRTDGNNNQSVVRRESPAGVEPASEDGVVTSEMGTMSVDVSTNTQCKTLKTLHRSSENPPDKSKTLKTNRNEDPSLVNTDVNEESVGGEEHASGTAPCKGAREEAATSVDNGNATRKGESNHDEAKVSKTPTNQVKAKERARSAQDSNNLKDRPGKKARGDNSIKLPDDKDLKEKHENGVKAPTIEVKDKERATSAQDSDNLKDQPGKKTRGENSIKLPQEKDLKEKQPVHENGVMAPSIHVKVKESATSAQASDNLKELPGKKSRGDNSIKLPQDKDLKEKLPVHGNCKSPTIHVKVAERATFAQDSDNLKDQSGKKVKGDSSIKPLEDKDLKEKLSVHENGVRPPTIQVKVKERAKSERDSDNLKGQSGKKARGGHSIKRPQEKDLKEKLPVHENGVKAGVSTSRLEEKINGHGNKSPTRKGVRSANVCDDLEGMPSKKAKVADSLKLSEDNRSNIQKLRTNNNGSNEKDLTPTDISSEDKKNSTIAKDSLGTKKASKTEQPDENERKLSGGKLPKMSGIKSVEKDNETTYEEFEINRKPDDDKDGWFTKPPWEKRLQNAYEQGVLVLLQNLDPNYTSEEVEDIVWHAFNEHCTAKMVPRMAISSPFSGQALIIFKTREATERVLKKLDTGCLMLSNGRPLVGSRGPPPNLSGRQSTFFGHLVLDKIKIQMQREMKDAVSTSHCSQPNTIEYEMAMDWCALQTRSEIWWKNLYKGQREELQKLNNNLKRKRA